jgi:hypothetical protein
LAREAKGAAKSLQSDFSELLSGNDDEDRPSSNLLLGDPGVGLLNEPVRDSSPDDFGRVVIQSDRPPDDFDVPPRPRARRGRLDLAALLYELAPNCRLAMEPGAGTEVFGNEAELQRAVQLMLLQNPAAGDSSAQSEVEIRREADWIRLSVELGPDVGVSSDAERRWLHRVAIKHGGRFELRGSTQCLLLPADASTHAEVEALQRELEQAQMLGESYARELASVFADGVLANAVPAAADPTAASLRLLSRALLPALNQAQQDLRAASPAAQSLIALGDLLIQLTQLEATEADPVETFDATALLESAGSPLAVRAARRGVGITLEAAPPFSLTTTRRRLELLIRCVLESALEKSAPGEQVRASSRGSDTDWELCVQAPTDRRTGETPTTLRPLEVSAASVIAQALTKELQGRLVTQDEGDHSTLLLSLPRLEQPD